MGQSIGDQVKTQIDRTLENIGRHGGTVEISGRGGFDVGSMYHLATDPKDVNLTNVQRQSGNYIADGDIVAHMRKPAPYTATSTLSDVHITTRGFGRSAASEYNVLDGDLNCKMTKGSRDLRCTFRDVTVPAAPIDSEIGRQIGKALEVPAPQPAAPQPATPQLVM